MAFIFFDVIGQIRIVYHINIIHALFLEGKLNISLLSAWTEITRTYSDRLFFHHISLKILAISKDMPVLFASSGKKIVFVKYGTYFCSSTYYEYSLTLDSYSLRTKTHSFQ
jgi:hypothetical protein